MMEVYMTYEYSEYLAHHGVKGQKWGVRRYQNEDGTLKNPKGRQSSGQQQKKDSPEDIERRKANAKKILGIAAGVAAVAAIGYLGFKADYHLTGIRDTLRSQAANMADAWGGNRITSVVEGVKARSDAKYARALSQDTRRSVADRLKSDKDMHQSMKDAAKWSKYAKESAKQEKSYKELSKNLTRRQAASHFLKTKGHINVEHLNNYGNNVVYNKKDWDLSLIKKQSSDYRRVIKDKAHKAIRGY